MNAVVQPRRGVQCTYSQLNGTPHRHRRSASAFACARPHRFALLVRALAITITHTRFCSVSITVSHYYTTVFGTLFIRHSTRRARTRCVPLRPFIACARRSERATRAPTSVTSRVRMPSPRTSLLLSRSQRWLYPVPPPPCVARSTTAFV